MSIKVRQTDSPCIISMPREDWLDFFVFLYEFKEQAVNDEIEQLIGELITTIRPLILQKGNNEIKLGRIDCLNLYVHIKDFLKNITNTKDQEILKNICDYIKNYLIQEK